ncbi:MAG TPA: hypothetical protein VEY89_02630, partial [Candidatus Dormibacteraeota bacterium]|nr:hypothetical protein [Candidatus Dormibacteraeota bacterium]
MPDAPPPPPPGNEPPPPPGSPPAEETPVPEDRFRTRVAIAIAVVSILGAVVAFTGTLTGQGASELDQSGIEDTSTQQQVITNLSGTVEEDLRNLAPYQEDLKAADILQSQAATLDTSDPSAAAQLRA